MILGLQENVISAAKVLSMATSPKIVTLTRNPHSYLDIAQAIEHAKLDIKPVSDDVFYTTLKKAGVPVKKIQLELGMQRYASNANNGESDANQAEFEQILGHPLASFDSIVKDNFNP